MSTAPSRTFRVVEPDSVPEPCQVTGCGYPDSGAHDCPGSPAGPSAADDGWAPGSNVRVIDPPPNLSRVLVTFRQTLAALDSAATAYRNFGEPEMKEATERALTELNDCWAALVKGREATK